MQQVKLDQIDLRILDNLQSNGRITNVELSKHAGISAPPCLRRVRVLEEAGYIIGYHAEIDGTMLNYKETFFALVGLNSQAQNFLLDFEKDMAKWAEVRECHMIRGGGDFLLKVVARDKAHRDALTMDITEAKHVAKVTTFETIRTAKDVPGIPIDNLSEPDSSVGA